MLQDVKFGVLELKLRIIISGAVLELRGDGRAAAIPIHSLLLVTLIPVKLFRAFLNIGVYFGLWYEPLLPINYRWSRWLRHHCCLIVHDRPTLNRVLIVLAIDALAVAGAQYA